MRDKFPVIDADAYAAGGKAFRKGGSIKNMVEGFVKADRAFEESTKMQDGKRESFEATQDKQRQHEAAQFSFAVGFVDSVLDALRGIKR